MNLLSISSWLYAVEAGRQAHLSAGPLTDRWIAQCVVGQRWWWGILFLSVCCCCYVIAGVLFPVSGSRHAASPAKRQVLAWGRAGETVPRYLQLSSIGVERASCRPDRDETKAPLDCSSPRPFFPLFLFLLGVSENARDDPNNLSGDAASWGWVRRSSLQKKCLLCSVVGVKEVLMFRSSARTLLLWLITENCVNLLRNYAQIICARSCWRYLLYITSK